jgi:hypothetical protein
MISTKSTAVKEPKLVVSGVLPSQRYLVQGDVLPIPSELSGRRIPLPILDAHGRDVTETLDGIASSTKRITATGLPVDKILLAADKIAKEVLNEAL